MSRRDEAARSRLTAGAAGVQHQSSHTSECFLPVNIPPSHQSNIPSCSHQLVHVELFDFQSFMKSVRFIKALWSGAFGQFVRGCCQMMSNIDVKAKFRVQTRETKVPFKVGNILFWFIKIFSMRLLKTIILLQISGQVHAHQKHNAVASTCPVDRTC